MLYIGADHGGYKLKELLKHHLEKSRIPFRDLGARSLNPQDDYPPIAQKVARAVARGRRAGGVLLCRSGVGVAIVANKVKGVRAVLAPDAWLATRAKRDEDANVLCLPAERLTAAQAWQIVRAWRAAPFRGAARDRRRLRQIQRIES